MNILNLLTTSSEFIPFSVSGIDIGGLNWIGKLISGLFNLFKTVPGGVGLGAIVFTLILKTIVLPLDAYTRVKTKKQSLLMEKMRPQMEKLQKQYANDKQMYSQKVMELQKQNGFSPLGACLPMIISLVIFWIVFSAFSAYSNFAVLNNYNDMVEAYNASVSTYVLKDGEAEEGKFLIEENGQYKVVYENFEVVFGKYYDETAATNPPAEDEAFKELKAMKEQYENASTEADKNEVVIYFVHLNARAAAADYYRENNKNTHFLWIGNMWYPDSLLNKEVPNFSKFSSSISRAAGSGFSANYEESYNEVTYNLFNAVGTDKKPEGLRYNGYFVLILLSIGTMFLQQFIMMRTQKASGELSSVDGSGARTNKWLMILMPIMFGIFAFFYSAAFSVYMIVNTTYGIISTLIINKIVTVRFANKDFTPKGNRTKNRKRLK